MKKNLILGIIDNYGFWHLEKFFRSLARTGYADDVCMFVGPNISPGTIRKLQQFSVRLERFENTSSLPAGNRAAERFLLPNPINYYNYRHYLYYDFVERHGDDYENVLLTDVRDVIFQRDPFSFEIGNVLNCALEGPTKTIRECSYNGSWVEFIFGQEGLDRIGDELISCAGTTWGPPQVILQYLNAMLDQIQRLQDGITAIDQAIHNYLIYTGLLGEIKFLRNDGAEVLTLSYEDNYRINSHNEICVDERVVRTIHQYPRRRDLSRLTDELFGGGSLKRVVSKGLSKVDLSMHKIARRFGVRP